LIFGFQEEWQDFEKRNPLFLERFPRLQRAIETAFNRNTQLSEPIDKFVLMYGRVCVEDLYEIVLCCGNGLCRILYALYLLCGFPRPSCEGRNLIPPPVDLPNQPQRGALQQPFPGRIVDTSVDLLGLFEHELLR
jgi:hypothetical protein